jgi:menaquinone-9 beta-reductase
VRRDTLIIGGGPAGSAAAITLARSGHQPIVLERATGPNDKVCGDFLSIDAIDRARALGVDPAALGAATIHRVRLVCGTQTVESALPFPALGLSRRTLDAALLRQAEAEGAVVRTGQSVRRLTRNGTDWDVQTNDTTVTAETVFLATGKHDLRDQPRPHSPRDAIGMKTYLSLAPGPAGKLEATTELTLFPGGYAGMQFVENGRVVLCIAIKRQAFRASGGTWASLLATISRHSRAFAAMLAGSCPLLPRPLAVAGIPYGYQARGDSPAGLFRLGDQAAVIASLTGDGMAIALDSGRQAAESWLQGIAAPAYQTALADAFAPRIRLAGMFHHAAMSATAQAVSIAILRLFPSLLRHAASHTRLPLSAAPVSATPS